MPPPTVKEVADRAGVSAGTVSNVLNRPEVVSEETRLRVLQAIDELGFVRNGSARALRVGRSRTIGMLVLDVGNPFFTDVARGAEDAASDAGHVVILCNSDESEQRQDRHLQLLAEQRVHGVLITPVDAAPEPVQRLRQALYPRLLPIAQDWYTRLGRAAEWPSTLDEWLAICHEAGQQRPTPILLRYHKHPRLAGFIRGVGVTVVGVLVGTSYLVAQQAIGDWLTASIAIASLAIITIWKRIPEPLIIAFAGAVGLVAYQMM